MRVTHDLVVTRYNEDLAWVARYAQRPGWRVFVYLTGRRGSGLPPVCSGSAGGRRRVRCSRIPNAGYEWHGYLRHVIDRYETLAPTTIFLQGDPLTVSPDVHCLLNATRLWAPVQVLSWVQMAKRKMEFFTQCRAANLGGCRVYVEPVTAGMRPMLHGDRWLHRACRMAKRFKGSLFRFLASQLGGDPALANGSAAQHKSLLRATPVPPQLYRAYGAQFAAAAEELRRRPKPFYTRLLRWLVTPHDAMHTAGFLGVWRAYTPKATSCPARSRRPSPSPPLPPLLAERETLPHLSPHRAAGEGHPARAHLDGPARRGEARAALPLLELPPRGTDAARAGGRGGAVVRGRLLQRSAARRGVQRLWRRMGRQAAVQRGRVRTPQRAMSCHEE